MKPSRELDALIAKKVFGLVQSETQSHLWRDPSRFENPAMPLPNYSTSISDAWTVVEKLISKKNYVDVYMFGPYVEVEIKLHEGNGNTIKAEDPKGLALTSAPHAICLAALKAVEGK